jgi:hypothetical protein
MYGSSKIKRYGLDKLALFGLFVLSLATAQLVVTSRSAIRLSAPIELPYSGLSLSVPAGNGWQNDQRWKYQQNGFTLKSVLAIKQSALHAQVHCRYLLAADSRPLKEQLNDREAAMDGQAVQTGQTTIGGVAIDWARIEQQERSTVLFFGTALLPDGRGLNVELLCSTDESDAAEQVFNLIINSIQFTDNGLLRAGAEILAQIRQQGLDNLLASNPQYNQNPQLLCLLSNERGQATGFTMDVLADAGSGEELNIRAAGYYYIRQRPPREMVTFFQTDNRLQKFVWKTEMSGQTGTGGVQITADDPNAMTVNRFDADKENRYMLNPAAIPDILLDFAFGKMLDTEHNKILLDSINSYGTVTLLLVSRMPDADINDRKDYQYVFKTELLDGHGFSSVIYLDNQRQMVRTLLNEEQTYSAERTDAQSILRLFPERSEIVRRREGLLKQDRL